MPKKSPNIIIILAAFALIRPIFLQGSADDQVRNVIEQFEQGLKNRNLKAIEAIVTPDIVVLENGHRNSGWVDFRDNHLVPEMTEPAAPSKSELIHVKTASKMGWGYTKTQTAITRKTGENITIVLWSAYFLERRGAEWKIAFLDWSIRPVKDGEEDSAGQAQLQETVNEAPWSIEKLEKRLRQAGLKTRREAPVRQPFLDVAGRVLVIGEGEAEVQVYIYRDEQSRASDTAKLDFTRAAPATMQVSWLMPATMTADKNLAVIVLTRDAALRARIEKLIESKR